MEPKVQSNVNFRAVVRAEVAPFIGLPDLAVRHMRREGTNYFRFAGENNKVAYPQWQEEFVRNPVARLQIGAIGRLAGAGISLSDELRGHPVKIVGIENKDYITVLDSTLKEHSWIPSKAFISNDVLVKAGYEQVPAHLFVFRIETLQKPLEAKLPGAVVEALDVTQNHVLFQYKDHYSVYGYNKSRQEFNVSEFTGLYESKEMLQKITGLNF